MTALNAFNSMQTLLISSEEILEIAFPSTELPRPGLIGDTKIEIAQIKYLKPVFGKMYDRLAEPEYGDFVHEYLKLPLALYVKSLVIDEADVTVGAMGILQPQPAYGNPVSSSKLALLKRRARNEADRLLRLAVEHVENNPERYPEYIPEDNILHRVGIRGGIVL